MRRLAQNEDQCQKQFSCQDLESRPAQSLRSICGLGRVCILDQTIELQTEDTLIHTLSTKNLAQNVVAGSKQQKCGLKYVI